jgi:predicted metal-dependent enzyme (double-stranded beta helix superfamily)
VFAIDGFVADAQACLRETDPQQAVRELLERAMSARTEVANILQPRQAGMRLLYTASDLTIIDIVWPSGLDMYPHDHGMWAGIGIYTGQEDNTFFRRVDDERRTVAPTGGLELRAGDVLLLDDGAIHGVHNPLDRLTAALHVYGGDFLNEPRSQWGPDSLEERAYDLDLLRELTGGSADDVPHTARPAGGA